MSDTTVTDAEMLAALDRAIELGTMIRVTPENLAALLGIDPE